MRWRALVVVVLVATLATAAAAQIVYVRKNTGTTYIQRRVVNLIEGSNVTLTVSDDSANQEVDITIASSGGGGLSDADYGDITVSGGGTVMTIDPNVVTNAKAADMAANTVKANATAGGADPADLAVGTNTVVGRVAGNIVAAQLVAAQVMDDTLTFAKLQEVTGPGVLGRAAGTLGNMDLITCANGSFLQGIGGNLACTTIDGASIDAGTVPYAKIQSVTDARLLGRSAGSAGAPMEITIGSGLSLVAGELAATGGGGGLSYAQVAAAALAGF